MKKKFAGIVLAAAALIGVSATPASAVTKGTIQNYTQYGVYTSSTYPTWSSQGILPTGYQRTGVASFQCFATCISQWGYNYHGRGVVAMTTTGTITLHD